MWRITEADERAKRESWRRAGRNWKGLLFVAIAVSLWLAWLAGFVQGQSIQPTPVIIRQP